VLAYMYKIVNRAGRWERFCRSIYQKVDLSMEAKNARKRCKQNLETIKGGFRGSKSIFARRCFLFGASIILSLIKCGMTCIALRMKSTTQGTYQKTSTGKKFIPYLTDPAFVMHIPINVLITGCFPI